MESASSYEDTDSTHVELSTVCMASEQKKGLLLSEITIGCGKKTCKSNTYMSGSGHCLNCTSMLPREADFPRVTIFIVDFIFFYVTIYSLSLSEW